MKRRTLLSSLMATVLAGVGAKKIFDYAAKPTTDKPCDFVFPANPTQTTPFPFATTAVEQRLALQQHGGVINDASCLNQTAVYGIMHIASIEDVRAALAFARDHGLTITSAGQRHSMGGHSFARHGLVLDMRGLKAITINAAQKIATVQAGATWADLQQRLDAVGLSMKAVQSINIFTVGGTLSVNAHGIAHDPGPIAPTVRAMRVMLADGTIVTASPAENTELFRHVLGGYGLFGVILEVDLDVVDNEMYAWRTTYLDYSEFPEFYRTHIHDNPAVGLMYGRLSMSPTSYLREAVVHQYDRVPWAGDLPALQLSRNTWISRLAMNISKTGSAGRWIRWMLEKHVEPAIHICTRNTALNQKDEACLVSRNQEMYDAMGYLKNRLPDTDILQEYFLPPAQMPAFVDGLRRIVQTGGANLLNVTIRIVHHDTITALPYAKQDMFAFVLYFNQRLNEREGEILRRTTAELVDLATGLGGTFYLPYQLYYSPDQLRRAYPEINAFFTAKRQYDPTMLFSNSWYARYGE